MHADGDVDHRKRRRDRHETAVEPRRRAAVLAEINLKLLLRVIPPADQIPARTGEGLAETRHGPHDVPDVIDDEGALEAAEAQREFALDTVREEDGAHARPETSLFVVALRAQVVRDREERRGGRLGGGREDGHRQEEGRRQNPLRRAMLPAGGT